LLSLLLVLFTQISFAEESTEIFPESDVLTEPDKAILSTEKEEGENIYRFKDIYIISGKPDTKVQLSFKLRIIKELNLYFGYSQLMFWKLGIEESNPFSDIAFNPEVFYTHELDKPYLKYLSYGLEHRSNGKQREVSRSFDRIFAQFDSSIGIYKSKLDFTLRLFAFYDLDETNKDIQNYMGFWDTQISWSNVVEGDIPSKVTAYLKFFPGGNYSEKILKGGREIGIKYRVRLFGLFPYLMLQSYHGHSESLLDYDVPVEAYRIGFLL